MEFFTVFKPAPSIPSNTEGDSLTQQSFKDDCDINVIIRRFQEQPRPDVMSLQGPRVPMWGDFSSVPDVRTVHEVFTRAEKSFAALPAALRARFSNNPVEMLAFVETASPEQLREVFGAKAPVNTPPVVDKVAGVSAVNAETVKAEAAPAEALKE